MCLEEQPVELLTLDILRCLGLELVVQFSRSFVLSCVRLWKGLHESVFAGEGVGAFKTCQLLSFTRLTTRCFFLFFDYFSFIFPFPGT